MRLGPKAIIGLGRPASLRPNNQPTGGGAFTLTLNGQPITLNGQPITLNRAA